MIELLKELWQFYTVGMYEHGVLIQLIMVILSLVIIYIALILIVWIISIPIRIITFPFRRAAKKRLEEEQAAIQQALEEEIAEFEKGNLELSVEEFFELREKSTGKYAVKEYAENFDCTGIYLLHNKNNGQYYVWQSENVLKRVNQHFTGGGNADVYADYKHGNTWTVRIIPLWNSGFKRLNALEKYGIELYDAYRNGYNKTRGNA